MHGRGVDDPSSLPLRHQLLCCFLTTEPRSGQINGDDLVPHLERRLKKRHLTLDARVIYQDVEASELPDTMLDQGSNILGLCDVRSSGDGPPSSALYLLDNVLGFSGMALVSTAAAAPSAAKARAMAFPMPDDAPVTTATLFSSRMLR